MDTGNGSGQPATAPIAPDANASQAPETPHKITVQPALVTPSPRDHIDAPLIALEQERADLQAQANAQDGDDEANTTQDRVSVLEVLISRMSAHSPVGIAIKLRRLERTFQDKGGAPWDQQNFDTALDALDRMGDVNLILWEQEHDRLYSGTYEEGEELNRKSEQWNALVEKIVATTAHTPIGIAVKLRLMRSYMKHSDCDWFDRCWDSCLASLVNMAGTPTPVPSAGPTGNLDAKLFALEAEMKAAHEGFHAATAVVGSTDEDHQPWYDRMMAVEEAAQAIPAQTAMGVLAKVRMAAWYQHPKPSEDNEAHEIWLRNIVADAQRVGAAVPVDPDAAPQDLWQEFLQNRVEWNRAKEDTDEYERCGKESSATAERITAIPAQGVYGLAVKLMIGTNVLYENRTLADEKYQDERAVISARDDAMRLTGLGGAA